MAPSEGDSSRPATAEVQQVQVIYLIRHGEAGSRKAWAGPDSARPLTPAGVKQAAALVEQLRSQSIVAVLSSPFRRCLDSVEPLARQIGADVEGVPLLGPDEPAAATSYLREVSRDGPVAVCTHGEVIGHLLNELSVVDGLDLGRNPAFRKGSFWSLRRASGRFVEATYTP